MTGLALALLLLGIFGEASAQDAATSFPNRSIKIVVPFPAGGPTDINIRVIAQKLSETWGQGVVIENRPGANTGIGASQVAKSPADGYTLLAAMDTTLVMNPASGASMSYDPFKDFTPITITAKNTSLLTVRADDGPKDHQGADRARQGFEPEADLRCRHHHHPARRAGIRQGGRHRSGAGAL